MKSAILLGLKDISKMKQGRMVEVRIGTEMILVGIEKSKEDKKLEARMKKVRAARKGARE